MHKVHKVMIKLKFSIKYIFDLLIITTGQNIQGLQFDFPRKNSEVSSKLPEQNNNKIADDMKKTIMFC